MIFLLFEMNQCCDGHNAIDSLLLKPIIYGLMLLLYLATGNIAVSKVLCGNFSSSDTKTNLGYLILGRSRKEDIMINPVLGFTMLY